MPRLLLAVLALLLAAPASAFAATVRVDLQQTLPAQPGDHSTASSPPTDVYVMLVSDPDGANDDLQIDASGRVRDRARPLGLGGGCAAGAEGWVACAGAPTASGNAVVTRLRIETGAGDDRVATTFPDAAEAGGIIDLGPGDDQATLGRGNAWGVTGGEGADRLTATGDALSVVLWDGGPGPDAVSGAAVSVSYARRVAPVHVTPDGVADDGEAGEGDDVGPDVGEIAGGKGPDVLAQATGTVFGGDGDDTLIGTAGRGWHQLRGEAGNDRLVGGPGDDRLDGDDGNDRLEGGAGKDRLSGGSGADVLAGGDGDDVAGLEIDGAPDAYDGGPGDDAFFITDWRGTATVTLDGVADDGPLGERDRVSPSWERVDLDGATHVTGGPGDETFTLRAGGTVDGGGGDDVLTGWGALTGGPGRDVLRPDREPQESKHPRPPVADARDGAGGDRIECFAPRVTVRRDRGDRTLGCAGHPVVALTAPAGGLAPLRRTLRLGLTCWGGRACRGTLWLRAGGRRVGHASFGAGSSKRHVTVPVRRAGRAACGTARATVRLRDAAGRRFVQDLRLGPCEWGSAQSRRR